MITIIGSWTVPMPHGAGGVVTNNPPRSVPLPPCVVVTPFWLVELLLDTVQFAQIIGGTVTTPIPAPAVIPSIWVSLNGVAAIAAPAMSGNATTENTNAIDLIYLSPVRS
ncbi:MAG: hypothetical protein JO122_07530 [Acetobacteraceae bacterium]|nr:hypothetical protein [Acetobacteraceae bacterium]